MKGCDIAYNDCQESSLPLSLLAVVLGGEFERLKKVSHETTSLEQSIHGPSGCEYRGLRIPLVSFGYYGMWWVSRFASILLLTYSC